MIIVSGNHATLAASYCFIAKKTKCCNFTKSTNMFAMIFCTKSFCRIFNNCSTLAVRW